MIMHKWGIKEAKVAFHKFPNDNSVNHTKESNGFALFSKMLESTFKPGTCKKTNFTFSQQISTTTGVVIEL